MRSERRRCLTALGALVLAAATPVWAQGPAAAEAPLRVAVYNDFPPYSFQGKGIDVDLARALADKLGRRLEIVWFNADEDMNGDLRNMVWKGHYLGPRPADVMMHVPADANLARANEQVRIFGPYHVESIAIARDPARVPPVVGSAAVALEVFTREKVGVELAGLADSFLLGALNGRLRENVVHYRTVMEAAAGLRAGEVAAVMATRAELEAALAGQPRFVIGAVKMPELRVDHWPLGMAVKADQPQLAEAITGALAALRSDGTVARIFASYGITPQAPGN
jgi:polar amino acid transport system substrate-binding protein